MRKVGTRQGHAAEVSHVLTFSLPSRVGTAYLCMKTVERAHKPAQLWHRVALDNNYAKALKQVDELLAHWYVVFHGL